LLLIRRFQLPARYRFSFLLPLSRGMSVFFPSLSSKDCISCSFHNSNFFFFFSSQRLRAPSSYDSIWSRISFFAFVPACCGGKPGNHAFLHDRTETPKKNIPFHAALGPLPVLSFHSFNSVSRRVVGTALPSFPVYQNCFILSPRPPPPPQKKPFVLRK